MNKSIFAILGSVAIVISSVSCVSGKKYQQLAGYKQAIYE